MYSEWLYFDKILVQLQSRIIGLEVEEEKIFLKGYQGDFLQCYLKIPTKRMPIPILCYLPERKIEKVRFRMICVSYLSIQDFEEFIKGCEVAYPTFPNS